MSDSDKRKFLRKLSFKKKTNQPQDLTERQVLSVSKKKTLPSATQWKQLFKILSKKEKISVVLATVVFLLSIFFLAGWYIMTHRVEIPAVGGEYTEALIGEPQLINPLFASANDVDADLTQLIYSGLMKWDPNQGLIQDLASKIDKSEDGLIYKITINDQACFHNGEPVRARDVLYTINAIQNPLFRSPLSANFNNVLASQVDDKTVSFELPEPYAPFLSKLTVGIMPADIWADVPAKNATLAAFNLEPIGSGPYRFLEFEKDKKGLIRSYALERNNDYYGHEPKIERLIFKFYSDFGAAVQALENRNVEGISFVPGDFEASVEKNKNIEIIRPLLLRQVALFFNQEKQAILKKLEVRKALTLAIDKEEIITKALFGHGQAIEGVILPGLLGETVEPWQIEGDLTTAKELLDEAGYKHEEGKEYRSNNDSSEEEEEEEEEADSAEDSENEPEQKDALTLKLSTVTGPEFETVAKILTEQFKKIGIKLEVDLINSEQFFASVLEQREYDILLTGALLGADPDPYSFWHSSQITEGGLNLANYANRNVDALIEQGRKATDDKIRLDRYQNMQKLLAEDLPAIFLYQSTYTYALTDKIKNIEIETITAPSDRFANVVEWYVKTKKALR
ncbi:ABC transporter substrate-binding protein [Patescibacteria group bacterium]